LAEFWTLKTLRVACQSILDQKLEEAPFEWLDLLEMPKKSGGKKRKAIEEKYKLVYFDIEGFAETSRLLFAAGHQEFEDKRYPFENKDGKIIRTEWEAEGKKLAPFGKIPYLEYEGVTIPQSRAIENFLAKKLGFHGKGPVDAAQIEAITEQFRDITGAFRAYKDKGEEELKKYFSIYLPQQFDNLEKLLEKNKSGFFVSKKPTLADITAFRFLNSSPQDYHAQVQDVLKNYPLLSKLKSKVGELEGIKEYYEKRNKAKESKPNPTPTPQSTDKPAETVPSS